MKLRALRMANARRFGSEGVAMEPIDDGLNVFAASNEAGKSTLFDGLQALLFVNCRSKASLVRSLRPYAGGWPHIAADVEFEGGLYRIEKRFLGQAFAGVVDLNTGQEIAVADEAQAWIDRMIGAEGGDRGPAGLLWVRQGESSRLDQGAKVRAEALNSVIEEEVTTLTGGERVRRVLERCAGELGEMVKGKGKPKANGGYDQAVKKVEQLSERQAELKQKMNKARAALGERHGKQRRFAELTDPEGEEIEKQRVSAAQEAKEAAQKHQERVDKARTERDLATLERDTAKGKRDAFAGDCDTARAREEELAELQKLLPRQRKALAANNAERDQRHDVLQEVEKTRQATKDRLYAARIAQTARQAKARHDELAECLAEAEAADKEATKKRAAAKALGVRQDDINELNGLSLGVNRADSALNSVSTRLQMRYEPGYSKRIAMGSMVLEDEAEVRIDQASVLAIDEVGKLTISPGTTDGGDDAQRRLRGAREALADKLEQLNCENLEQALARRDNGAELLIQAERAESIVAIRAPGGIEALRIEVAQLREMLGAAIAEDVPEVAAAERALDTAETEELNVRSQWEAARRTAESTSSELKQLEGQIGAAILAHKRALDRIGLPPVEWTGRQEQLDADFHARDRIASKRRDALQDLLDKPMDRVVATANLTRLTGARENRLQEIGELGTELAVLRERIDSAAEEGVEEAFSEVSGRLDTAREHVARYEAEIAALRRLKNAVEEEAAQLKDRYLEPVYQELASLLGLLYEDAHLDFDGEKLTPQQLTRAGVSEDVNALSGGTREQVAILTRLAFARLLAKSRRIVPIILDDALIFSDDDRIEKMFTALHLQASDLQMLVFSCRQRAFRGLGGTVLRLKPWKTDQHGP